MEHQIRAKKKKKILSFMDQCAAHPRDTTALKNIEVIFNPPNCTSHLQPLHMGEHLCQYTKQLIWKAAAMNNRELLGDARSPDL